MHLTRRRFVGIAVLPLLGLCALPSHAAAGSSALNAQFLRAAQAGNRAAALNLLARGANVNARDADGSTALLNAIRPSYEGGVDRAMIQLLLARRANVNAGSGTGQTPLMAAAAVGDLGLAKLLLSKGARVNAEDKNGQTPLFYAAAGASNDAGDDLSSPGIVKLLLSKGARVNATDYYGQTPLIVAAKCATNTKAGEWAVTETVRLLLAHGALVSRTTESGFSALKWAKARNHPAAYRMIYAKAQGKRVPQKAARKSRSAPSNAHAGHGH